MKILWNLIYLIFFVVSSSEACTVSTSKLMTSQEMKIMKRKKVMRTPSSILPFAHQSSNPIYESRLGNLLLEHRPSDGTEVILSLPVKMLKSNEKPFGDEQSNAKMDFSSAPADFPVFGIQKKMSNGKLQRTYIFHPSLKISKYDEIALAEGWFKVKPQGWEDSFYFSFQSGILPISEFIKGIPSEHRTFTQNRIAPDQEKIGKGLGTTRLQEKKFGEGYLGPFPDPNVHAMFPNKSGKPNAVGGVTTWGINLDPMKPHEFGPFKQLYTCFDARNEAAEKETGAPSGAGWHFVGAPGETILNNLVEESLPVGIARSHGFQDAAHGLTESITATWFKSDEAFVTRRNEFHWYLNPYPNDVCTEIWVQNQVPNLHNSWGFQK